MVTDAFLIGVACGMALTLFLDRVIFPPIAHRLPRRVPVTRRHSGR